MIKYITNIKSSPAAVRYFEPHSSLSEFKRWQITHTDDVSTRKHGEIRAGKHLPYQLLHADLIKLHLTGVLWFLFVHRYWWEMGVAFARNLVRARWSTVLARQRHGHRDKSYDWNGCRNIRYHTFFLLLMFSLSQWLFVHRRSVWGVVFFFAVVGKKDGKPLTALEAEISYYKEVRFHWGLFTRRRGTMTSMIVFFFFFYSFCILTKFLAVTWNYFPMKLMEILTIVA